MMTMKNRMTIMMIMTMTSICPATGAFVHRWNRHEEDKDHDYDQDNDHYDDDQDGDQHMSGHWGFCAPMEQA